jgi:hypothetical protein
MNHAFHKVQVGPVLLYDFNGYMHQVSIVRTDTSNVLGPNFNQVLYHYILNVLGIICLPNGSNSF